MTKIVLCGGHLSPALALIEKLEKRNDIEITFLGRKFATEGSQTLSAEYQTISKKHIKFFTITTGRLQRRFTRFTLPSILKIPIGFIQSFIILLILRPKLVVSFGGYLSTPVVFSAWLIGFNCISHEQSIVPGLATRINSLFVKKVFLAWPQTLQYFQKDDDKFAVIGNLTRDSVLLKSPKSAKINGFLKEAKKLLYVTGGNQGSHFFNLLILQTEKRLRNFSLLHQVGTANYKGDFDKARMVKNPNYLAVDYLESQDQGAVLHNAEIVISRAGANTVWDLALLAKPAILVPLPIAASNEQDANAQTLVNAGSAVIISQDQLTPDILLATINHMIKNLAKYQKAAAAFQKTLPKDGLQKFSDYILKFIYQD